jgi:hypothetical protein
MVNYPYSVRRRGMSYAPLGSLASSSSVDALLRDLASRKEFRVFGEFGDSGSVHLDGSPFGFLSASRDGALTLGGLRFTGAQQFVRAFGSPDTGYLRLLLKWQTGTGKSIAAICLAVEYVRQFRARASLGGEGPTPLVFVLSFTPRETIQEDMLIHPEFGFTSIAEVGELRRLRALANEAGAGSEEARRLSSLLGSFRRRLTDRARGGYFQFYGYKEFANRLFSITRRGLAAGFDVQTLYKNSNFSVNAESNAESNAEGEEKGSRSFGELLSAAVRRGLVTVDEDFLNELRGGYLVCDEVHVTYNINEKNNYGIAIQYVLDTLGDEAPRAVFLSATPTTGSAKECVDLLNLLVPQSALPGGTALRRSDFFTSDTSHGVSRLREGTLERIGRLAAGRVSFLLDSDVGAYPRRVFVGEELAGTSGAPIQYLRFTPCPMSPFQERTLVHLAAEAEKDSVEPSGADPQKRGLPPDAYTLYDMAYPNPAFPDAGSEDSYGLFRSGETPPKLAAAPDEWRAAVGVRVEKGAEAGVAPGTYVISGDFLGPERIGLYSAKYALAAADVVAAIRAGPGKLMLYHHRVRMSGVLQIQEVLRAHGLADETSAPTDATLCAICGRPRRTHLSKANTASGLDHEYTPARFVVAHGAVDRSVMLHSIARFNALANLPGYSFRVIVASKIVRQSLNFSAVRHMFVLSLPGDIPTLLQVFGRVARKYSHRDLPADQRDVRFSLYVSTHSDGKISPEVARYADKMGEYLVIQEIERALHADAVDGFANWGRINEALRAGAGSEAPPEMRAQLDALPYSPALGPEEARALPVHTASFEAYGFGEREVATIAAICRALFRARPVWTYEDLWAAVHSGAVRGVNYDPSLFDEGNFAAALLSVCAADGVAHAQARNTRVFRAGRFYIACTGALDVGSYLRPEAPVASGEGPGGLVRVRVADYLRSERAEQSFAARLLVFEAAYLASDASSPLEAALVECDAAFHYALLRRLIVAPPGERVTSDDDRVAKLYYRFRIAVGGPADDKQPHPEGRIAGYVTPEAVTLFDSSDRRWYNAPLSEYGIERRLTENDILVGFVSSAGGTSAISAAARFKVRLPVQALRSVQGDIRTLARGAVCETRPRAELVKHASRLRDLATRTLPKNSEATSLLKWLSGPPEDQAAIRAASASNACTSIKICLLALEEASRLKGPRYLYLYCDRPPSVAALSGLK